MPPLGLAIALTPGRYHGFIATSDCGEIDIHRNVVEKGPFDELKAGLEVLFGAVGDEGPQATNVRLVGIRQLVLRTNEPLI